MTRKLPEIQLRAAPKYVDYYKKRVAEGEGERLRKPIHAVEARDFLLFQILQVMTAPFLAMVIFASMAPESTLSAVVIGFGAGFASEPLLLRLRQMIDQLAGLTPGEASAPPEAEDVEQEETPTTPETEDEDPKAAAKKAVVVARQGEA